MRTRGGQRNAVEQFADVWAEVRRSESADDAVAAAGFFTGMVSGWRTEKVTRLDDEINDIRSTAWGRPAETK
jgi:hypothetical protein